MTIVVGLDLSLTSTGIAVIEHQPWVLGEEEQLIGVTTVTRGSKPCPDDVTSRADRLTDLAAQVLSWVDVSADLVCVERPAYSSNSGSVTDRAGLWWLVCARIVRGYGIPVVDVVSNHLKMYATGKGNAGKDVVLAETVRRYDALVPKLLGNDEADALQLAALGWHHLTGAPLVELPLTHHRAVTAVKWPADLRSPQ